MPIGPARMPLFDHLGELRMRLVRIVACLAVGLVVFYMATPTMGQFLLAPIAEFLPTDAAGDVGMQALDPFEAFSVRFEISLWASVVACSPVILWQLLAFFLPALKPKERKWFVPTFAAAVALFIIGTIFCYLIILNPAFQWLTDQADGLGYVAPRMSSYVDMIIKFELAFGFAFELPLVIFYLVIFDIVPYKKLRGAWRTVYVALMVLSAIATPDASPVTMVLMFAALILLYELSLFMARVVLARRIKAQNAASDDDDDDGSSGGDASKGAMAKTAKAKAPAKGKGTAAKSSAKTKTEGSAKAVSSADAKPGAAAGKAKAKASGSASSTKKG